MNYAKMQLDPGLFIVSIRYDKIKLNYPQGDNGQDRHHLPIPPSSSSSSTFTLFLLRPPYCVFPVRTAAATLVCGSNGGFTAHRLHGQLRSGGIQAVRSFTFARGPSPRSAATH